ncbi:hypothetical protein NLU13_0463 [Sarocladium strictum]|uniref:Uncharacterized protein n=1 Tax=Sarocladium strictum TaxID=5046 RepID=A0AA39LAU2_SARSR|nr:hypothetical protein NLU13_0463 [Sarocladium strictum]
MSAYGGYTKTSYGAQGGDDSGGFFAGSQQGSQGGGGGKTFKDESLRPETFAGGDFKIDNAEITQITFVGQVRSVTAQPTNVTLKIDDGTGQIEVKKWIDADKAGDDAEANFEIDSHVRVWGRLKSFSNKRHVGAHVIRPVTDPNEVNYHMLEADYVHLFFSKGPLGGAQNGADGDSMFVDGGAGYGADAGGAGMNGKLSGCSPLARKMFQFMSNTPGGNEGVNINIITSQTGMQVRDVLTASDELLGQGLIYTTVDDETWAILEF